MDAEQQKAELKEKMGQGLENLDWGYKVEGSFQSKGTFTCWNTELSWGDFTEI